MLNNNDQMITLLIGMVPDILADHLVIKYAPGKTTFDEMVEIMQDHLLKLDQKKTAKKRQEWEQQQLLQAQAQQQQAAAELERQRQAALTAEAAARPIPEQSPTAATAAGAEEEEAMEVESALETQAKEQQWKIMAKKGRPLSEATAPASKCQALPPDHSKQGGQP